MISASVARRWARSVASNPRKAARGAVARMPASIAPNRFRTAESSALVVSLNSSAACRGVVGLRLGGEAAGLVIGPARRRP
jgi:hypothetical protein